MQSKIQPRVGTPRRRGLGCACAVAALLTCPSLDAVQASGARPAGDPANVAPSGEAPAPSRPADAGAEGAAPPRPTLEETRLALAKWIETQQIIARERNEWQQGREILKGRVDLVRREVTTLEEKISQSQASVTETNAKRDELAAERDLLKVSAENLAKTVSSMEAELRRLSKMLPEGVKTKLQPLYNRIPEDPANTRVSVAERFQNVLGILNEVNKANSELSVSFEVRTMPDGSSAEVQVLYVGLAQAYYVSPRGEAGVGRPTADGWRWEPLPGAAERVLAALEILQGKQTPAFVPLPVKIQ